MLAEQHFVAGPQIGVGQHGEERVRAVAAATMRAGSRPIDLADGLAQDPGAAFGIELTDRAAALTSASTALGLGPKRAFVGRQLDDLRHAGHGGAPADIGRDVQNAGLGRQGVIGRQA